MKSRFATLCALVCLCVSTLTAGCGSSSNVTVTITSPTGPQTVEAGQAVNITASASSTGGNDVTSVGVKWSLTGVGCSGGACGTLTSETGTSVAYEAPPAPPSANVTVYVVATSATGAPKSASIAITVEAISVQIKDKVTQLAASGDKYSWTQFFASVQGDPEDQGVTWSLTANGTACSPACGTLSLNMVNTVQYQPPATAPAAPDNTPTITAIPTVPMLLRLPVRTRLVRTAAAVSH